MTGWTLETDARHIPDEELHAYLDQALSRSQCVEIECHLAECRRCQIERNKVAAVRDRTTALLADAVPRRVRVPSFEQLVAQHQVRRTARILTIARFKRGGLMAAGLAAAVGAGWFFRGTRSAREAGAPTGSIAVAVPSRSERTLVAMGPVTVQADSDSTPTERATTTTLDPVRSSATRGLAAVARDERNEPILQVNAIAGDEEPFALDGLWQTVDLRQATDETAGNLPRIEGLPIVEIQLQRGVGEQRPIVVVAQQHPSGVVIRTIEGPIERVEELLEKQASRASIQIPASAPAMTPPDYLGDGAGSARRGLRILTVTGSLPTDSLNAMARAIEIRR